MGQIPSEIGNLTNLERLYLKDNQLSGLIPSEIGNLVNLQRLYLNENELSGEIPSELGNLVGLSHLYLSDNLLSGQIPFELCNQGDTTPDLENNQLCPPYIECLEVVVGEQNISNCD